jgi:hypothetical protein
MAIYLPFGIAFFQLNIARIDSVSSEQTRLLSNWTTPIANPRLNSMSFTPHSCVRPLEPRAKERRLRRLSTRWNAMTAVQQTELFVGVGMVIQVRYII